MAMYTLSTAPLINKLEGLTTQLWFANDAAATGFAELAETAVHLEPWIWVLCECF